jgi:hypothetical protein
LSATCIRSNSAANKDQKPNKPDAPDGLQPRLIRGVIRQGKTMKHVVVYEQAGVFAGWPANNGIWNWDGRETLVGFTVGAFEETPGHNIQEPYRAVLAKSLDQGESWTLIEPKGFVGSDAETRAVSDEIDFTNPAFAMRVVGTGYHGSTRHKGAFLVSNDRGDTWLGPYSFGDLADCRELGGLQITARTDYVVEGPRQCLLMMSVRGGTLTTDRVFCARTEDGGRSFRFVSWVVPPSDPYRAVMPSTVRCYSGALVSAVRRREPGTEHCWIDAYLSEDAGRTWTLSSRVANTGGWNGNPPALAAMRNGRLCCVFGDRRTCRILAKYSADCGRTWGDELILRDDFQCDKHGDPDLGYPRVVQHEDGRLLACYYWATAEVPHQHIAATIWDAKANTEPAGPGDA